MSTIHRSGPPLAVDPRAAYRRDGYLTVPRLFSAAEVAELRAAVVAAYEQPEDRERTRHHLELTLRDPRFRALAADPRIVDRIRPLIGEAIQLQHAKLATKPLARGVGPFGWHQDFAYFPHTNTDLCAVMVLLDDADEDNGCLNVVRGSHRLGLLDHDRDGTFQGQCVEARHWEEHPDRVVPIAVPAGSISIHHCLTLHGSQANRSGRPRRALVFQYRAADAHQFADRVFADTGTPIHGHWDGRVRCEAGVFRLPFRGGARPIGSAWQQWGETAAAEQQQAQETIA